MNPITLADILQGRVPLFHQPVPRHRRALKNTVTRAVILQWCGPPFQGAISKATRTPLG
jgi:hypothetical protein